MFPNLSLKSTDLCVGLFGGTFDPPHLGHYKAAKSFIESGHIDALLVLPAPDPPHKVSAQKTSFEHRLKMSDLAFDGLSSVCVSDFENQLSKPSYTFQTLQALHEAFPDRKWFLCIGADSLNAFSTWFKWEQILEYVHLLVVERPGSEPRKRLHKHIREKTIWCDHALTDASSTEIREGNKEEVKLAPSVLAYVREHKLYQFE